MLPPVSRLYLYTRLTGAWLLVLLLALMIWSQAVSHRGLGFVALCWLILMLLAWTAVAAHVRRVRQIVQNPGGSAYANRHRRQIEMPMDAGGAFDVLEATIRELPDVEEVQSARDSLQIRAKVRRVYPWGGVDLLQRMLGWFGTPRNQIYAYVTPHAATGTINLVCEPESGAWRDWFLVDNGTNLQNAEAISRAISRRINEARRTEQAETKDTATEKELAVARLHLLHAQVEPHFLYNTLGSAKYLIRSDPAGAERIIDSLILYLRHSLPRLDAALSTLGDEIERVRAYLDIMQIRMGERLKTAINVPDALRAIPFPTMMLQTLVENAIKHGLEPKTGGGTVWIMAVARDDRVAVTVADDGIGLATSTAGSGIGLRNVRERLQLAYGSEASFDLAGNFPECVAATITVPARGPGKELS